MSEYGYEDYGVDDGGYDVDAITAQAAQGAVDALAYLLHQNEALAQLGAYTAAQTQAAQLAADQQQDEMVSKVRQTVAERHPWMESRQHQTGFRDFLMERDELVPNRRCHDPAELEKALDEAAVEYEREQSREAARISDERAQSLNRARLSGPFLTRHLSERS